LIANPFLMVSSLRILVLYERMRYLKIFFVQKKICQRRKSSCLIFRRASFLVGIQLFFWTHIFIDDICGFFFRCYSPSSLLGARFFIFQTFNAIGIFRSLVDDEWTDNIAFFKSFFSIVFFFVSCQHIFSLFISWL